MTKVLITGGTGLVGEHLQKVFLAEGYKVVILSRTNKKSEIENLSYAHWNVPHQKIDVAAVCSADHIIHLAGTNIGEGRWTQKQKKSIVDSRVDTAAFIFKTLKENKHQVKTFISASGADCYGVKTTSLVHKESDDFGTDFLADVCQKWEKAAENFVELGIRTVYLRTGLVCATSGSALQKMATPIRMGFGSALGTGKQIMSLIHIEDLCNLYLHALKSDRVQGAYNAVSVNSTNLQVTKQMASILHRPLFMPKVPAFVLNNLFGEMATILLEGSAVDNTKIKSTGFSFKHQDLKTILENTI